MKFLVIKRPEKSWSWGIGYIKFGAFWGGYDETGLLRAVITTDKFNRKTIFRRVGDKFEPFATFWGVNFAKAFIRESFKKGVI